MSVSVLVLYDGRSLTQELEQSILQGIRAVDGAEPIERPLDDAQQSDLFAC